MSGSPLVSGRPLTPFRFPSLISVATVGSTIFSVGFLIDFGAVEPELAGFLGPGLVAGVLPVLLAAGSGVVLVDRGVRGEGVGREERGTLGFAGAAGVVLADAGLGEADDLAAAGFGEAAGLAAVARAADLAGEAAAGADLVGVGRVGVDLVVAGLVGVAAGLVGVLAARGTLGVEGFGDCDARGVVDLEAAEERAVAVAGRADVGRDVVAVVVRGAAGRGARLVRVVVGVVVVFVMVLDVVAVDTRGAAVVGFGLVWLMGGVGRAVVLLAGALGLAAGTVRLAAGLGFGGVDLIGALEEVLEAAGFGIAFEEGVLEAGVFEAKGFFLASTSFPAATAPPATAAATAAAAAAIAALETSSSSFFSSLFSMDSMALLTKAVTSSTIGVSSAFSWVTSGSSVFSWALLSEVAAIVSIELFSEASLMTKAEFWYSSWGLFSAIL